MDGRVKRICTSFIDVPNRIAVAIYFAGCSIRCKGCQNPDLWDPLSGELMSDDSVMEKVQKHPLAEYVVFLGGEPTDQMEFLQHLCNRIKQSVGVPIALYTGREFEVLPQALLNNIDLIVCGPYRIDLHVGGWPASSNQRILKKEEGQWI
jgi:anaerobic ribonucleoside-triphosphate reductase activating protein